MNTIEGPVLGREFVATLRRNYIGVKPTVSQKQNSQSLGLFLEFKLGCM